MEAGLKRFQHKVLQAKSRSEQAPRSGFQPTDKSDHSFFGFLGPPGCNKFLFYP